MAKNQVAKADIKVAISTGTTRNLYASWTFSYTDSSKNGGKECTASYKWEWRYYADGHWFDGSSGTTTHTTSKNTSDFTATYNPPDNATKVDFRVKPVSKTYKKDDKDTEYFTGKWSSRVEFNKWYNIKSPETFRVEQIKLKVVSTPDESVIELDGGLTEEADISNGTDLQAQWSIFPVMLNTDINLLTYLSSYDFKWEGYNGRDWTEIKTGSRTVSEADKTKARKAYSKPKKGTVVYTESTHITSEYRMYKFSVTPVASNDQAFTSDTTSATKSITAPIITVNAEDISVSERSDMFYAIWSMDATTGGMIALERVKSYEVEWQYRDNNNSLWLGGDTPADTVWTSGGSGTVEADAQVVEGASSYVSSALSNAELAARYGGGLQEEDLNLLSDDEVLSLLSTGIIAKTSTISSNSRWAYTFALPSGLSESVEVRVRIKALCDDTKAFTEAWSGWYYYSRTVPTVTVTGDIEIKKQDSSATGSARKLDAIWSMASFSSVGSFAYRWYYCTPGSTGIWRSLSSGTVDVSETMTGRIDPNTATGTYQWYTSVEAPSDAAVIMIEVEPVGLTERVFSGTFKTATYPISIPTKAVENVKVQVYNKSTKTLMGSWDAPTNTDSSVIGSYEYLWQFYYLNTWIDGANGSSTVTSRSTTYSVPDEASQIRLRVRPVATSGDIFVGEWSEFVYFGVKPSTSTMPSTYITIRHMTNESNTVIGGYTRPSVLPYAGITTDISGNSQTIDVIFEWSYYRDGVWWSPTEVTKQYDYLYDQYAVPEYAEKVRLRVKPNIDDFYYHGEWSDYKEYNIFVPSATVGDISVSLQRGTQKTCVATWASNFGSDLENFSYKWRYNIDGVWFEGTEGTASAETPACTYEPPEGSTLVQVSVMPNPKYEYSFKGEWSNYVSFTIDYDTPAIPDVPTVSVNEDGYYFTASLDSYDENTASIEFQVVNDTAVWNTGVADLVFNRATYQFPVAAGDSYRVRARGRNEDGDAGDWSNYSSSVSGRPGATVITSLGALSSSSLQLTWNAVLSAKSYTIERTKKKNYFDAAPDMVTSQSVSTGTTLILTDLDASEWFFRVKAVNDAGDSSWSEIQSVLLGAAPDAPTTWSSRMSAAVGSDIYLYWMHNAEDGSTESLAELEIIVNGISSTVSVPHDEDSSIQSSYKLPTATVSNEATIQWRVKTKGVLETYGEWSTQRIIKVYAQPNLQVTLGYSNDWVWDAFSFPEDNIFDADGVRYPIANSIIQNYPILVYFDSFPASQTPVGYILTVTSNSTYETSDYVGNNRKVLAGQEIYKRFFNTNKHGFMTMLLPWDIDLESGMSYTFTATVAMDSGLTSEQSLTATVEWDEEDFELDAEISFDRDRVITYIRPYCNDGNGVALRNIILSVYRRDADGGFTEIAKNISNIQRPTITDPHPSLDYARYRIVGRSTTTGQIAYYDIPAYPIGETSIILQWNEQWHPYDTINEDAFYESPWAGSLIKLPYNVDVTDSNTVDVEMVEYIGRSHPVSYFGTQVGQTLTLAAAIDRNDKQTIYDLRRLAIYMGNVYVREPSGSGYWAHVEVSFSQTHLETVIPVSIKVVRVEGGM